jgi:hypothetical protein
MHYRKSFSHFLSSFLLFTCMATPAAAIPVAVVGSVDNLLARTSLSSSGKGPVESWVSGVLGFTVSIDYKNGSSAGVGWELVNGTADQWAHSLANDPGHFLLKLGVGNSGADTHYLYENLAALSWAVIDLSEMLAGQALDFNFGRVSHIAEFNGTTSLSEPGSFGFLVIGLSLFGWVIARNSRLH